MDGNARWAKKNKVNKKQGYIKGLNKIKEIVNLCLENSINYLTIYALSSENINRIDVNIIFKIISENIGFFLDDISSENKVKVKVIGNKDNLPLNINEIHMFDSYLDSLNFSWIPDALLQSCRGFDCLNFFDSQNFS